MPIFEPQEKREKTGSRIVNRYEIGDSLNLNRRTVDTLVTYFEHEDLLRVVVPPHPPMPDPGYEYNPRLEPLIGITHKGIKEVEDAFAKPNSPTEHLPPASTIVNFYGSQIKNSAFQVANKDSSQK